MSNRAPDPSTSALDALRGVPIFSEVARLISNIPATAWPIRSWVELEAAVASPDYTVTIRNIPRGISELRRFVPLGYFPLESPEDLTAKAVSLYEGNLIATHATWLTSAGEIQAPSEAPAIRFDNVLQGEVACSSIPATIEPRSSWGREYSGEWGCAFQFSPSQIAAVFLHRAWLSGDYAELVGLLNQDHPVVAHIITCEGSEWTVKGELTRPTSFGVVGYTERGYAMISGTGILSGDGDWLLAASTVYPGVQNRKSNEAKVSCSGGTGGVKCEASYTVRW